MTIAQIAQIGGQKTENLTTNHQPPKHRNLNGLEVLANCVLYLNLVLSFEYIYTCKLLL